MKQLDQMELKIAKLLRFGVLLCGVLLAIGWLGGFVAGSRLTLQSYKEYDLIPLQNFLIYHFNHGNWFEILSYLGLLLLILLPLIRIFLTALLFIRQKDYLLGMLASLVLLIILISFGLGIELD